MRCSRLVLPVLLIGAGLLLAGPEARADEPGTVQIAIPNNATMLVNQTQVIFIGRPTSTSAVNCAPGSPKPQTVVAIDPGGGSATQITGVLAFHDHEISLGSRYRITNESGPCNADLKLYTGTLD